MGEDYGYRDAWPGDPQAPVMAAFHGAIRKLAAERFAATGKPWEEVVHDRSLQLTREDFEQIEADLLATGHRFEVSADITYPEASEKHKPMAGIDNVFSVAADGKVATELFGFSRRGK